MKTLLMDDDPESRWQLAKTLNDLHAGSVVEIESLQEVIELADTRPENVRLIVCNYRGTSVSLLKLLAQVSSSIPCIVFVDENLSPSDLLLTPRDSFLEVFSRGDKDSFYKFVKQLVADGYFTTKHVPDEDFLRVSAKSLSDASTLGADIYLRLAPGRYCKRFQKSDAPSLAEVKEYLAKKDLSAFYMRKDQLDEFVAAQGQILEDAEEPRRVAGEKLDVVHDLVSQIGFTPKVQELAKKTVLLMLKAIGSSPSLSDIMQRMRMHQGRYITSHSVMLAELSCAVAHRIGWNSASTFLKLTMASFIHDLTLPSNELARERIISSLTPAEQQTVKLHPSKAAEYAVQLEHMPPDVDTIIAQHHELPDGSGFPRGLYHHQIIPLSAIFIISHDLLDFFLTYAPTNRRDEMLHYFLGLNENKYAQGTFGKICASLRDGTPFVL